MLGKYFQYIFFICFLGVHSNAYALMPLENLLLGEYSIERSDELRDPLDVLFQRYDQETSLQDNLKLPLGISKEDIQSPTELLKGRIKLGLYRGFIEEGYNLENECKAQKRDPRYPIPSEKDQAKRVFLATLQYKVLDITTYFLPAYAKFFEWSKDDYVNLVENLMGNFCSQNLTTLSLRNLKKNMIARYSSAGKIKLPSVKGNVYFPKEVGLLESRRSARAAEFAWTIELFKSSCSWGNDPNNYRLLVPLLRNPSIAASVIRELTGKGLTWIEEKSSPGLENQVDTTRIACKNLICRKTSLDEFEKFLPRALGSTSIERDFKNLFCSEFRDADYQLKFQVPKISKKIKSRTFDEERFLNSQLIALLTGVPDILIMTPKFSDLKTIARTSLDQTWRFWADGQNENYKKSLAYEEALSIELVPTRLIFKKFRPKFSVELDVNQGEFDRVNNILGKIRTKMNLTFSKKFLKWARSQWKVIEAKKSVKKAERIKLPFKKMMEDQMDQLLSGYPVVPLRKEIDELIIDELLSQLSAYDGNYFDGDVSGFVEVPVYINYGLFALRHLKDRYQIKRNQGEIAGDLEKLRSLRL